MKKILLLGLAAGLAAPLRAAPAVKFGHHRYREARTVDLAEAGPYRASGRRVKMRAPAASAFQKMAEAARRDGVSLIPISGFRSREYQRGLFERARRKYGDSEREAAKWVAPPGYSEHHTGWTLDLGDGDAPDTDVDQSFEKTKAFLWLRAHAADHQFELSFPLDNPQGVSYEPWHWRFLGEPESRRLFHPASGN